MTREDFAILVHDRLMQKGHTDDDPNKFGFVILSIVTIATILGIIVDIVEIISYCRNKKASELPDIPPRLSYFHSRAVHRVIKNHVDGETYDQYGEMIYDSLFEVTKEQSKENLSCILKAT